MGAKKSTDELIANYTIKEIYPMYLAKVEKKGRTKEELNQVIAWLTGFDDDALEAQISQNAKFVSFFDSATLNPNAHLITGVICGYRVEDIENPLTQKSEIPRQTGRRVSKGQKDGKDTARYSVSHGLHIVR